MQTGYTGYDFQANGFESVTLQQLTNTGTEFIDLNIELFQSFNGTGNPTGTGPESLSLAVGESQDIRFDVLSGGADFVGFRLSNQSPTAFSGTVQAAVLQVDSILLGDVNCDGIVNLLDVSPFVSLLASGRFDEKADTNMDGFVDLLDVAPFVELLTGG